ncbi:MAG: bifunctional diguanylate cyclase/phosphodiesterase [Bacillus sp. (in: Bacteria)]|nr:bifunctional diguanylate cyclase/phosphodiesterase [Bacillus sp. (in: firmicutes)]MCM1427582.1 bifunctional diguanylate cyclase/phosphodiesterase [Eubacterium sp.]
MDIAEELKAQIKLLSERNKQLMQDAKMLRLICDTSSSAFLYYNYKEDKIQTIANWNYFFDFEMTDIEQFSSFYDWVEEKYTVPLREVLFLEKRGMKTMAIDVKVKESRMWVEVETNIIYDEEGHPTDKIIRFKDVTKFNSQNDQLTYMSYYDLLTGLYNRNYFVRLLGDYVHRAKEENKSVSVMFIDLDDFRKLNDGLGIIIGDEIVQLFGQFLSNFAEENVMVSHFGSDLYCIGIYDPCGDRNVGKIYGKISDGLKKPLKLSNGQEISLTVSIGVAEYPEAASTALELINCAEIVMFKAKSTGKGKIQNFDGSILEDFLQNVTIENKLKEAIFEQNFMMYFQPQYHTSDRTLRGVEALIRWKDDNGKTIHPDVFIPIAEKNGTIVPIGTWVMEESVRIYAGWKKKYHYPLLISLNVSAIQYKQPDFVDRVMEILKKYNVAPEEIELEITETILIDDFKEIIEKLIILRNYGIKISLDDFGTGYSSLSYLKGLPIDTLKIDKSFIDTVVTDENTRIITESIIYMVKKLGFETIAEGVETQEQYDYLMGIDCDNIQGYYLGKPMPPEEIEALIEKALA